MLEESASGSRPAHGLMQMEVVVDKDGAEVWEFRSVEDSTRPSR